MWIDTQTINTDITKVQNRKASSQLLPPEQASGDIFNLKY